MKIVTIDIPDTKTERLFKEFASENGIKILPIKSETSSDKKKLHQKLPNIVTKRAIENVEAGKSKRVKDVKELMSKILS